MVFNTRRLVHLVKYALSDSGASSHFLIKGSLAVNIKVAEFPIAIKLPDGSILWSTHTCNLDIPWLPHEMTEAHVVDYKKKITWEEDYLKIATLLFHCHTRRVCNHTQMKKYTL